MSARLVVPKRSSNAVLTSGSSSISSWTISSLEIVAAPWRANACSASLFPAPMPPVIATSSRLRFGLGLSVGDRLRFRDRLGSRFGLRLRDGLLVRDGGLRFSERIGGCGRAFGKDFLGEAEVRRQLASLVCALVVSGAVDALHREREAAALGVHLEDQHLDVLALRDDLARVLDVVLRE